MFKFIAAFFAKAKQATFTPRPTYRHSSRKWVCVRCLTTITSFGEIKHWTVICTGGVAFHFCRRCGVDQSLNKSDKHRRYGRCLGYAESKLKEDLN